MQTSQLGAGISSVLMLSRITFGITDIVTDILYYSQTEFTQAVPIKSVMLFILIIAPCLQIIIWAIILGQQSVDYMNYYNQILTAKSTKQYIKYFIIQHFKFGFTIAIRAFTKIPLAILIGIAYEIKIFPILLFVFVYRRHKILITTDLMLNLNLELKELKKEQYSQIQVNQNRNGILKGIKSGLKSQQNSKVPTKENISAIKSLQSLSFNSNSRQSKFSYGESSQYSNEFNSSIGTSGRFTNQKNVQNIKQTTRQRQNDLRQKIMQEEEYYLQANSLDRYKSRGSEEQEEQKRKNKNKTSNIDLILDANLMPTISKLLDDQNLSKFFLIADLIEAVCEALPMTILQYLNNQSMGLWFKNNNDGTESLDLFIVGAFLLSACNVIFHFCVLTMTLLEGTVAIFFDTLKYLEHQKQISDDNNEEWLGLGNLYPIQEKVTIDNLPRLQKFKSMTPQACERVTSLQIDVQKCSFNKDLVQKYVINAVKRSINLQELSINIEKNSLNGDEILKICQTLTKIPQLRCLEFKFCYNEVSQEWLRDIRKELRKIQKKLDQLIIVSDGMMICQDNQLSGMDDNNQLDLFFALQNLCVKGQKATQCLQNIYIEYRNNEADLQELILLKRIIESYHELQNVCINLGQFNYSQEKSTVLDQIYEKILNLKYTNKIMFKANNYTLIKNSRKLGYMKKKGDITRSKAITINELENNEDDENEQKLSIQFNRFQEEIRQSLNIPLGISLVLPQFKNLVDLNLNFESLQLNQYNCQQIFDSFKFLHNLKSLVCILKNNKIEKKGARYLAEGLKNIYALKTLSLDLSSNDIQNEGFQSFIEIFLYYDQLEKIDLNLENNSIQGSNLRQFGKSLKNQPYLSSIQMNLKGNEIMGQHLYHICYEIKNLQNVTELDLNFAHQRVQQAKISNILQKSMFGFDKSPNINNKNKLGSFSNKIRGQSIYDNKNISKNKLQKIKLCFNNEQKNTKTQQEISINDQNNDITYNDTIQRFNQVYTNRQHLEKFPTMLQQQQFELDDYNNQKQNSSFESSENQQNELKRSQIQQIGKNKSEEKKNQNLSSSESNTEKSLSEQNKSFFLNNQSQIYLKTGSVLINDQSFHVDDIIQQQLQQQQLNQNSSFLLDESQLDLEELEKNCLAYNYSQAINEKTDLIRINLDFRYQYLSIEGVIQLCEKLSSQKKLKQLQLNLKNTDIPNLWLNDYWFQAMENFQQLEVLQLNLTGLQLDISNINQFSDLLQYKIRKLKEIMLYLEYYD